VEVQLAGGVERVLITTVGLQEAQVRGLLAAKEAPLVEDDGPGPDGENHQDQEDEFGDQSQGGEELK